MKALTVKPAWALMFFCENPEARKDVENRSQRTNTRGRIAIHASSRFTNQEYFDAAKFMMGIHQDPPTLAECRAIAGKIIGTVELWDCVNFAAANVPPASTWYMGEFAWMVRDPIKLRKPIGGVKGSLGFWEWDYGDLTVARDRHA